MTSSGRRIAIVGAGPAGVYAAQASAACPDIGAIDVLEALPTPYGLVRYGVAPDHPRTKAVARTLDKILTQEKVRFLGNVRVGSDLTHEDLQAHYAAVVYCTGAHRDRSLAIPGEEVPGSHGAAEFVAWYSGHPDASTRDFLGSSTAAVVVGGGNVALDVARVLTRRAADFEATDVPEHVLRALRASRLHDVHLLVRRGPAEARFSPPELRELGELPDVDIVLDASALAGVPEDSGALARDAKQNVAVLSEWIGRRPSNASRRVHVHFWTRPTAMHGDNRLTRVETLTAPPGAEPRRGFLDVSLALRAVGYAAEPVLGLPFDPGKARVPNERGRVVDDQRRTSTQGAYVAGWLKRGPSGVIGTNRVDAVETVTTMVADLSRLPNRNAPDAKEIVDLLRERGVRVVEWHGWRAIQAQEAFLGAGRGIASVKIHDRAQMLAIASSGGSSTGPAEDAGLLLGPNGSATCCRTSALKHARTKP